MPVNYFIVVSLFQRHKQNGPVFPPGRKGTVDRGTEETTIHKSTASQNPAAPV